MIFHLMMLLIVGLLYGALLTFQPQGRIVFCLVIVRCIRFLDGFGNLAVKVNISSSFGSSSLIGSVPAMCFEENTWLYPPILVSCVHRTLRKLCFIFYCNVPLPKNAGLTSVFLLTLMRSLTQFLQALKLSCKSLFS